MLFSIFTAIIVKTVPIIIEKVISSFKKIALNVIAAKGTRNIKVLTSLAPSFSIPKKYIVFAKVDAAIAKHNMFIQKSESSFSYSITVKSTKKIRFKIQVTRYKYKVKTIGDIFIAFELSIVTTGQSREARIKYKL